MKSKPNRESSESWMLSGGLWLACWALEALAGLDWTHSLVLVLIGVLAWFVLYLAWFLPSPKDPRWKTYLRVAVVICAAVGLSGLSVHASDLANWIALGAFAVVIGIGVAWGHRPIRHTG